MIVWYAFATYECIVLMLFIEQYSYFKIKIASHLLLSNQTYYLQCKWWVSIKCQKYVNALFFEIQQLFVFVHVIAFTLDYLHCYHRNYTVFKISLWIYAGWVRWYVLSLLDDYYYSISAIYNTTLAALVMIHWKIAEIILWV